jgi:hypothetical protein
LEVSVVGGLVFVGRDVVELAVQAPVVEPIDPLHGRVFDVVDGAQGPVREGLPRPTHSVLNKLIVVSANALSEASPTLPMDAAMPSRTRVSANAMDVYCDPASALSRIRLNSDYADVCVKPGICTDGLRSPGLLVDFSA